MRFTRGWLEDHLDLEASDADLQERLTAIGLEVEEWDDPSERFQAFVTARVLECLPHPRAPRLSLCSVRFDEREEPVQVVCGAHNVRKGFVGVFAPVGSVVPSTGVRLKAASLQGEASHGMLLSERELGLSDEHEGILEISQEISQEITQEITQEISQEINIGKSFATSQGLDDPVCTIAVTPNRADCLGVRGIARDLAASGMGRLKPLPKPSFKETFSSPRAWRIDLPADQAHHCPFVCGRSFRNLTNAQAPKHIRARLNAVGIKSLSALVDMTNYLTLDLARPLHVFDARKLAGDALTIRKTRAQKSPESFAALDHKTYALPSDTTVIADAKGVVSMAGIMGGEESGCSDETQEMFLECALFDPRTTAKTGRTLNIESEARFRFERGLDPATAEEGCDRATELVLAWCGGEASTMTKAGAVPQTRRRVFLPKGQVQKLGGVALEQKAIDSILERLGFEQKKELQVKELQVKEPQAKELQAKEDKQKNNGEGCFYVPPSWRADVTSSACLVEEVLRIHGYDAVPEAVFARSTTLSQRAMSDKQKRCALVRRKLAIAGLYETITWSFLDSRLGDIFTLDEGLRLQNPISAQLDCLRSTLLANLGATAAQNRALGRRNTALFEVGPQFSFHDDKVAQEQVAVALRAGPFESRHWHSDSRDADLFDAKADLRAVFEACGLESERLESQLAANTPSSTPPEGYHPHRYGLFLLGRTLIGRFGELHPALCQRLGLRGRVVACEAFLDRIPAAKTRIARKGWQRQKQQSLYRDFACWIPEGLTAAALKHAVLRRARNRLKTLTFFDRYEAKGGEISLAFEVEILPHAERALSEAEVQALLQEIVESLQSLNCRMREG